MDTIQFTDPVENNNEDWKKKKNYRPAALVTVLLLGMAFLAGNYSYASSGRNPPTGSLSAVGGLSTLGVSTPKPIRSPREEIPVEVIVPQAMQVQELEGRVTEVVRNILSENERRDLASVPLWPLFSVYTGETKKTECASIYSTGVACYDAIIFIVSETRVSYRNHADVVISKLQDLLRKVVDQQGIVVGSNKKGYPYVQLKNDTPYPIIGYGVSPPMT